jgi:Leucine-rich repeat (LRR) protein
LYIGGFVRFVNNVLHQNLKGLQTLSTDLWRCTGCSKNQFCINSTEKSLLKLLEYHIFVGNTTIFNLTRLEALRVLELKGDHLTEIPDSIAQLRHLSHLWVISDHLQMLPESIGLLYNGLQYLPFSNHHNSYDRVAKPT